MEKGTEQIGKSTFLARVTIKPNHEEDYLALWKKEAAIRQKHGFKVLYAFIESGKGMRFVFETKEFLDSGDEKVFTWVYCCDGDFEFIQSNVEKDPDMVALSEMKKEHILLEDTRAVKQEIMNPIKDECLNKMVIMRRYNITNDWDEFMEIWRRIVPVREKYGFPCLFAVSDKKSKVFTWAFTYDGDDFDEFLGDGQVGYYSDPQRVELETVNNYLAEIRLTPARQILA